MAGAGKPLTLFHLKVNAMKRVLLSVLTLFLMSVVVYGQQEVTTFLGIPVDGSKSEMIQKLKEKGFKPDPENTEALIGEFNGMDVNVFVVTNKDKVWRIMVCDAHTMNETDIRIRFNKLCQQFDNNKKYMSIESFNREISEDEDIAYEMTVNHKRYEAIYYQNPTILGDSIAFRKAIQPILLKKFTEEQLANPTEEIQKDVMEITIQYIAELSVRKSVWFMISDLFGQYYISMYYDNEYNRANGEDL